MIIKVKKPIFLGQNKLNKTAQRVAVKNIINKQIKLVRSFGEKISEIIIIDGEKKYSIKTHDQIN